MTLTKTTHGVLLALMFTSGIALAPAQEVALPVDPPANAVNPVVGGAAPDRTASAVESLARSSDHKRLVEALEAAGLTGAINAPNPLTVFAPTDAAFSSSTYMSFSDLMREENKGKLAELLRYHIVAGSFDTATLDARIDAGGGRAVLTTVQGANLVVQRSADQYTITDATNHTARITVANVYQRNGIVQVVDQVLMPTTTP
ncbi:MAG: fasciclin domain-containing protein [Arenimonas sp.]